MKGDDSRALAAGCDGYITKPIDTRTLAELISRRIEQCGSKERSP
jgi:CheY-like chemotaxis protein